MGSLTYDFLIHSFLFSDDLIDCEFNERVPSKKPYIYATWSGGKTHFSFQQSQNPFSQKIPKKQKISPDISVIYRYILPKLIPIPII